MFKAAREGRILVHGHRGARAYAPMNTLPSFGTAIRQKADGIELDVQLTADGHLVVIHDFTVDGTTDGSGAVKDLVFGKLREFNAAAKFLPMAKPLEESIPENFGKVPIPTLDEVFTLVRDSAGPDFMVNVEIKAPYCDADAAETPSGPAGIEQAVADSIARFGMADRVIISSFNPPTLKRFKALCPQIPIGFLVEENVPVDTTRLMSGTAHEAWHPRFSMVRPDNTEREHRSGRIINAWTVNDEAEALRLAGLGVAGIITDRPDLIRACLFRK